MSYRYKVAVFTAVAVLCAWTVHVSRARAEITKRVTIIFGEKPVDAGTPIYLFDSEGQNVDEKVTDNLGEVLFVVPVRGTYIAKWKGGKQEVTVGLMDWYAEQPLWAQIAIPVAGVAVPLGVTVAAVSGGDDSSSDFPLSSWSGTWECSGSCRFSLLRVREASGGLDFRMNTEIRQYGWQALKRTGHDELQSVKRDFHITSSFKDEFGKFTLPSAEADSVAVEFIDSDTGMVSCQDTCRQ